VTRLSVWGASDDLLEIAIDGKVVDELGCYDNTTTIMVDDGERGRVVIDYEHSGQVGWRATVSLPKDHDDGQPMVAVALSLSENGYSPRVDVELLSSSPVATFKHRDRLLGTFEGGRFKAARSEEE